MTLSPQERLRSWFLENKRSFPWREDPTPYKVWVSEVMLQQTRASVVIGYFNRWIERFPSLPELAESSLEEVFKLWEGLGYYTRARNLHKGACEIVANGGLFPSDYEGLLQISGIGPYTAGAILSFAFHKKAPAIDGNVERVISRYKGILGDLKKSQGKQSLTQETFGFLTENKPWELMEGLIELGAVHCLPKPSCGKCPLNEKCFAFLNQKVEEIPFKQKRQETIFLEKQVFVCLHEGSVLIEKKQEGQVLGGLFEFPSFVYDSCQNVEEELFARLGIKGSFQEELSTESQSFTRYRLTLHPSLFFLEAKEDVQGFFWVSIEDLEKKLSLSSGHKRILKQLLRLGI